MAQMFASYNKNNAKGTLVGNWVEEEALRSTTGFSRRKVPAPVSSPDAKSTRNEATHPRVLMHSNVANPQFETTFQASTNYEKFSAPAPVVGPRSLRRDSDLLGLAQQLHAVEIASKQTLEEQERTIAASTTSTKSAFLPYDASVWDGVTRVPRGRNGGRVVDSAVQHLTRGEVDSIDQMTLNLMGGAPVTRYSHAIATGIGLDFPATVSDTANPFARSSAFTNDIHDTTKRHGEATEPGQDHDERVGTSLHQRTALRKLVQYCTDPSSLAQVVAMFTRGSKGSSTYQFIELGEFRSLFGTLNGFTDREAIQIFMYFDADNIGAIRSTALLDFCGREVSERPSSTSSATSSGSSCNLRV